LDDIEVERIILHALTSTAQVSSFRTAKQPAWVEQELAGMADAAVQSVLLQDLPEDTDQFQTFGTFAADAEEADEDADGSQVSKSMLKSVCF
jgi:hypothetical protein